MDNRQEMWQSVQTPHTEARCTFVHFWGSLAGSFSRGDGRTLLVYLDREEMRGGARNHMLEDGALPSVLISAHFFESQQQYQSVPSRQIDLLRKGNGRRRRPSVFTQVDEHLLAFRQLSWIRAHL